MSEESSVIYVGHIPKGLFECQLFEYFSQFGDITRLKLIRSRRTGASKGYAFIDFKYPEAAQISSEAMNGYLVDDHVLKCSVVLRDVDYVFKNWQKKPYVKSIQTKQRNHNVNRSDSQISRIKLRQQKKLAKKINVMSDLGVDINLSDFQNIENA
ncbi:hypothetical protein GJ496_006130 [Pomphorhynchus laevis]|nr:hypothetical protein GJ496_006130 [Pomphorhynchus laevis]